MINPNIILWDGRKLNRDIFIECQKDGAPVIVQYNVTMRETAELDLSRASEMLDSFTEIGALARQILLFCFNGYDFDTRALAEIDEVRAYIRRIAEAFPHLWYFLFPELNQHIFVGLVPYTMVKSPLIPKMRIAPGVPPSEHSLIQLDIPAAERQLIIITEAVMQYGKSIDDERGAQDVVRQWRSTLNL